jgi:transcriptional regulator with XRE-family HTH domain
MALQEPKANASLISQALKNHRREHKLTQEELAYRLHVEPRTLRAWENERPLENIRDLRRIADLLGIEPERLGLAASVYIPKTPEEINEVLKHAWALMDEPHVSEARAVIEKLVRDTQRQMATDNPELLRSLAHVYHAAGYITGMGVRTKEVALPVSYYHQLGELAYNIKDDTLLNIALTYQGDMFRRSSDIRKALIYLEAARDTAPLADASARGNTLQLLGRTYLLSRNKRGFERAMAVAKELAYAVKPETDSTHGQYNLAAVYEEYAKNYGMLGQIDKALDYVKLAEAERPQTQFWETLLMIARAEIFIFNGDVASGKPLALEAARLSQLQGHQRRLERIYNMRRYLSRKVLEYGKAEIELGEILDGSLGRRDIEES